MTIRRPTTSGTAQKAPLHYRGRTAEQMQRRAAQSGTSQDPFIDPDVKMFSPQVGDNRIRVVPPTWFLWDDEIVFTKDQTAAQIADMQLENPVHYAPAPHFGYEVYVHYGIGTDNSAYLCLDKMHNTSGECPVCLERIQAEGANEKEYADSLKPKKRVPVYVIDRSRPQEGVLLWNMPWTIDRDICQRGFDKITGEVFNPDDPDKGYDITFRREGQGELTKYIGIDIARRSQPLSDDPNQAEQWLAYAIEKPIPSILIFHEPEYIAKMFSGTISSRAAAAKEKESSPTHTPAAAAPSRASLNRAALAKESAPKYTYDIIMAMTEEQVVTLCDERNISEDELGAAVEGSLEELKQAICTVMGLEKPANAGAVAGSSLKDRLQSRLQKRS